LKQKKLVERFKEFVGFDEEDQNPPEVVNRVMKEAYICKRMKKTRSELYEICIATGIDVMYEELRRKSGA